MDVGVLVVGVGGVAVGALTYAASRRDAYRRFASHVYLIVSSFQIGRAADGTGPVTVVRIVNGSDAPIFDVGLSAWNWDRRHRTWRFRKRSGWWTADRLCGRVHPTVLPNSETADDDLEGLDHSGRSPGSLRPPVTIEFRDGNGRRWVRWPDGKLTGPGLRR